ncbi:hypothetical protein BDF20DRAFT_838248 [Mycotypha africana]|uniref:uncharacterized protein n=1 Tax=Mycotypha africana TaxID=64632 RepID=UPI002301B5A0|nr:uncharacterized protein BDF20DRAFT_838248 [Mycotypha africana]KAI8971982.1 hypothetical protein BDF20DRAFT_838248 [Mycotypha africana]
MRQRSLEIGAFDSFEELKANISLAPQCIPQRVVDYDQQLPIATDVATIQKSKRPLPSLAFRRKLEELADLEWKYLDTNWTKRASLENDRLVMNYVCVYQRASITFNKSIGILPGVTVVLTFVKYILGCQEKTKRAIQRIPNYYALLSYICKFSKEVSQHAHKNNVDTHNLAVVFTPSMIRAEEASPTDTYMAVPGNNQAALTPADAYLKIMNKGISLVQVLITKMNKYSSSKKKNKGNL